MYLHILLLVVWRILNAIDSRSFATFYNSREVLSMQKKYKNNLKQVNTQRNYESRNNYKIELTVILSQPSPPIWQSGARQRVRSSSHIYKTFFSETRNKLTYWGSRPSDSRPLTKSTTSSLLITSQIPSQASTKNSWSSVIVSVSISGKAEDNEDKFQL